MEQSEKWLEWAVELQSLAQAGLTYGKDKFDLERYRRIRDIAAEMVSLKTDIPAGTVRELFCNETGYQTPKLDTRAALFRDGKILLVREENGTWSLPGGWVDVNVSVGENVVKEVREEAGLEAVPELVIAVQDRDRHNRPVYAHKICKIFVLCTALGGSFTPNLETVDSGYFPLDALPPLSEDKTTAEQIAMCFEAYRNAPNWKTRLE